MIHILQHFTLHRMRVGVLLLALCAGILTPVGVALNFGIDVQIADAQQKFDIGNTDEPEATGPSTFTRWVVGIIGDLLLAMSGWLVGLAGWLLTAAVEKLVIEMSSSAPVALIDSMWLVVRDVSNLAFVFGFLYIGVRTVINPEDSGTKRFLANIIVGALLINFSLFFTKVVVDIGNYTAVTIYNEGMSALQADTEDGASLSTVIMDTVKISQVFKTEETEAIVTSLKNFGGLLGWYLGGFVLFMFTAFVFFMGAFLLVARFGTLILILIASPILFAATVFPQTEQYSKDMWGKLIRSSFYPAIFLFLIFLAIAIIQRLRDGLLTQTDIGSILADPTNSMFASVALFFALAIFLMMQSIQIADKLSVSGGNWASSRVTGLRKSMQGFAGRNALRSVTGGARVLTAGALAGTRAARGQNWRNAWRDTRNISMEGAAGLQGRLRNSNSRLAQAAAAGMRATGMDATIQGAYNEDFGSGQSVRTENTEWQRVDRARATEQQVQQTERNVQTVVTPPANATPADIAQNRANMERALANSTAEQLLSLHNTFRNTPQYATFIGSLSAAQTEALLKREELDDDERTQIRTAREAAVLARISVGAASVGEAVRGAQAADISALSFATLLANAGWLTSRQINDANIQPAERTLLRTQRGTDLTALLGANGAQAVLDRVQNNDAEIAQLPRNILRDPNVAILLSSNVLEHILNRTDNGINQADRAEIRRIITNTPLANPNPNLVRTRQWLTSTGGRGRNF